MCTAASFRGNFTGTTTEPKESSMQYIMGNYANLKRGSSILESREG